MRKIYFSETGTIKGATKKHRKNERNGKNNRIQSREDKEHIEKIRFKIVAKI